ncbi:hypothetical protein [Streptomyces longwoodensis]|uniref:hypothetical protein n=1 Tax=Streptomyces longwoodensis TaxID=68231 RepID=UPI0036FF8633
MLNNPRPPAARPGGQAPDHMPHGRPADVRFLELARYTPLAPVPQDVHASFPARCGLCGARRSVTMDQLRTDQRKRGTAQPRTTCPHPAPASGPAPGRMPEAQARELLERQDYDPVGAYPGAASEPWHVRCLRCEAELWVWVTRLAPHPRARCQHALKYVIVPALARRQRAQDAHPRRK